jgi:hypothetical protein
MKYLHIFYYREPHLWCNCSMLSLSVVAQINAGRVIPNWMLVERGLIAPNEQFFSNSMARTSYIIWDGSDVCFVLDQHILLNFSSGKESFPLINGFPLFFNKIFGSKMCQTCSKRLENEGFHVFFQQRALSSLSQMYLFLYYWRHFHPFWLLSLG